MSSDAKISITVDGAAIAREAFMGIERAVQGAGNAVAGAKPKLDLLTRGMSSAAQQSSDFGRLMAGMSQAGRDASAAMTRLQEPTTKATSLVADLGAQFLTTAGGFVAAQAILGAVGTGFRALSGFVTQSIKAFSDADASQRQLTASLRQHGLAAPEIIQRYNEMATAFQNTTVHGDDTINTMQGLLTQVGGVMPTAMQDALQASADLSAGLGIDLQAATMLVAKAAAGHTETLGRYGITVSDSALKTQGFNAVLDAVNRQFGGQAAAQVETYAGKVAQLGNAWNNVQEAVGKAVLSNPLVAASLEILTQGTKDLDAATNAARFSFVQEAEALPIVGEGLRGLHLAALPFLQDITAQAVLFLNATRSARDADAQYKKIIDTWTRGTGVVIDTSDALAVWDKELAASKKASDAAKAAAEAHTKALADARTELANALRGTTGLTDAQKAQIEQYAALNLSVQTTATLLGISTQAVQAQKDAVKEHADAIKGLDDITKLFAAEGNKHWKSYQDGVEKSLDRANKATVESFNALQKLQDKLADLERVNFQSVTDGLERLGEKSTTEFDQIKARLDAVTRSTGDWYDALNTIASGAGGIPGTIRAIEQLAGAWKNLSRAERTASLTSTAISLGTDILANATENPQTKKAQVTHYAALGAKYGSVVPGLGTAAGAGIGAIVGALKVSPVEKNARTAFEEWQKQFGTLDETIDAVGKAYSDIGLTGKQAEHDLSTALDATHHSAEDVSKALETINRVLEEQKRHAEAVRFATEKFEELGATVTDVGIGLTDSMRSSIDAMLEMPGVTDEIKASLHGLVDNAGPDFARLESMAKGYGIELGQLGPAFQQAHVTADAQKWIGDFEKLMAAGADMNGVLGGMADEASAVVQQSLKFGTTVPENMKSMLEALAASGQLLDENGNKIEDITNLNFGPEVKTDVDKIRDAIKELREAIEKIPAALGAIPSNIPNPFGNWTLPTQPERATSGSAFIQSSLSSVSRAASVSAAASGGGMAALVSAVQSLADRDVVVKVDNQVLLRQTTRKFPSELRKLGAIR